MSHENKLGMFIHWGVYASYGLHEQALARYSLDKAEYERRAMQFNPTDFDPDGWVRLAKDAGMKYICFTAKHHDGFCMWDTAETEYKITNTAYGRDVLRMLADACEREGMLLSLYYSNPDWHHPYGYNPASTHQWRAYRECEPDTVKYREFVRAQVTELLTGYGRIYTFFWDIPPKIYDPSLNELVRRLQPGIFINDRGWDEGDFSTPEREYTHMAKDAFSRMTEACNSLGVQSWGYREGEDFYSLRHIISSIDRVMAMGGSYLLNVGPDAAGNIPEEYRTRLRKVGEWYKRTDGCLESASADGRGISVRGDKCIVTSKNGKSYLHFHAGLSSSAVVLDRYPCEPRCVRILNTGATLSAKIQKLPEYFSDENGEALTMLHIAGIPVDSLENEAIILEIDW